jgi:hypothetical protein
MVVERPTAEPIDDAVDNGLWFAGTVDYASTRALQELRLGCGDDIESLGNAWPPCIAEEARRGKQTLSPCSLVPILLPITNECWLYCARRLHALGSLAQEASVVWQRRLLHSGCRLQTAAEKECPRPPAGAWTCAAPPAAASRRSRTTTCSSAAPCRNASTSAAATLTRHSAVVRCRCPPAAARCSRSWPHAAMPAFACRGCRGGASVPAGLAGLRAEPAPPRDCRLRLAA